MNASAREWRTGWELDESGRLSFSTFGVTYHTHLHSHRPPTRQSSLNPCRNPGGGHPAVLWSMKLEAPANLRAGPIEVQFRCQGRTEQ